jgi:tRNA (cytosine38-C5)-methyltransferase
MNVAALELFAGIGGWRAALGGRGRVLAAWDVDAAARATYEATHGERPCARELATVPAGELARHGADAWLLSPPCQPFARMGRRRGLADPRSRALAHLMDVLDEAPPRHLVLENVEGFLGSDAHELLTARLRRHGFAWRELTLCPTRFGIPNRRPRVYVVASRGALAATAPPALEPEPLARFLDQDPDPSLELDPGLLARHLPGLDLVVAGDRRSACFIGGYGQRLVGSGSFLRTERGARRFSPAEIARLLGLPAELRFPDGLSLERRYRLLGNSLSVPVARWVLALLVE